LSLLTMLIGSLQFFNCLFTQFEFSLCHTYILQALLELSISTDRIVLRVGTAPRGGPHSGMARGHTLRISESVLTCCCIVVTLAGNKSPVYSSGHCLDVGIDPLVSPSAPGFDEVAGS
jgi:hypothetical protein